MKVWKRCLAVILAFLTFTTSVNFSEAAGTYDSENCIWTSGDAEILAEQYQLPAESVSAMMADAVNSGRTYSLAAPYSNGTEEKYDLLAVDYINKVVYARKLQAEEFTWLPVTAVLLVDGDEQEEISITSGNCVYNNIEYCASGAFLYEGHSYTVEVTYELSVSIAAEEQTRLLQIPVILAQTAGNLESNLKGLNANVKSLGDMVPSLARLLTYELPEEQTITNEETGEKEKVTVMVPAFDAEKDADVIASIEALDVQYKEQEGLTLYKLSEEYKNLEGKKILSYTLENGRQIQEESAALYEHATVLRESTTLRNVCRELYTLDRDFYNALSSLQSTLRNLLGSYTGNSDLAVLQEPTNWPILDENTQVSIWKEGYTQEEFDALEAITYSLRNSEPKMPAIERETFVASRIRVYCPITIYDVRVTLSAKTASAELEDSQIYDLDEFETTVTLLAGTTKEEIRQAVVSNGIEKLALDQWNAISNEYQINTDHYERTEKGIPDALHSDVECAVSYVPEYYKVKTNFRGNVKVPFGFTFKLPISQEEQYNYDYTVETENGTSLLYNEGVIYRVTQPVTIEQLEGKEKTVHRLYDFLITDVQYEMSEEAKRVLANAAVDSPTLKIRTPDGTQVGDVIFENGEYRVEAEEYAAGIAGMKWVPYEAILMNNDAEIERIAFRDGTASWTTEGFTHVKVSYQMKVEKVDGGLTGRPVDEDADVLYALNLPHEMVTQAVEQNRLLNTMPPTDDTEGEGDTGAPDIVSARYLYSELNQVSSMLTSTNLMLIKGMMKTEEEIAAIDRLMKDENAGGGWNVKEKQLALYTYLVACETKLADPETGEWSLAGYYKEGLYLKIAEQSGLVADCLEVITGSRTLWSALASIGSTYEEKMKAVVEMIPKLRLLSQSIQGPHEAVDMEHAEFGTLMDLLVTMEGKTAAVETSDGIYAYTSIKKIPENTGCLTVSVAVGSSPARTKELAYVMEDGVHILTEEEEARIWQYIAELEEACGLSETNKSDYDWLGTAVPTAGTEVHKNEIVSYSYYPREYVVTVVGIPDLEPIRFSKHDRTISLPSYSEQEDEKIYYLYWINGEPYKAENGSDFEYTFSQEELDQLFENGQYEVVAEVKTEGPDVKVSETFSVDGSAVRNYAKETTEDCTILYVDASPKGLTKSQFEYFLRLKDENNVTIVPGYESEGEYLTNGTEVYYTLSDITGWSYTMVYKIMLMGDSNADGKVDMKDIQQLSRNYLGTATGAEDIYRDYAAGMAADMNRNGFPCDSNDALLIMKKILNWDAADSTRYTSVLK